MVKNPLTIYSQPSYLQCLCIFRFNQLWIVWCYYMNLVKKIPCMSRSLKSFCSKVNRFPLLRSGVRYTCLSLSVYEIWNEMKCIGYYYNWLSLLLFSQKLAICSAIEVLFAYSEFSGDEWLLLEGTFCSDKFKNGCFLWRFNILVCFDSIPEASQKLKKKVKEGGMVTLLWINK